MKDYRIMGMSDFTMLPTGYANQTRNIFKRLAREPEFETFLIGCGYHGMKVSIDHDSNQVSQTLTQDRPLLLHGGQSAYGQQVLTKYFGAFRPDIFWWLLDSFMVRYFVPDDFNPGVDFHPIKTIAYVPSDGEPFVPVGIPVLKRMDYVVAMSKYCHAQLCDEGIDNPLYIPHGIQLEHFRPRNKEEVRLKWGQRLGRDLRGKFIVGSVNRNQGRKNLAELLRAFAIFAKNKPDALLLMHCDPYDQAAGNDLPYLARTLHIEDKILFTGHGLVDGIAENELAELYSCFDVQGSATTGEGFGITTMEAMACGVPSIITDCTTTKELVLDSDAGWGAKVGNTLLGSFNVLRFMVDTVDLADKMQYAYDNPSEVRAKAQNGLEFVRQFGWDKVYPQWRKMFLEVAQS